MRASDVSRLIARHGVAATLRRRTATEGLYHQARVRLHLAGGTPESVAADRFVDERTARLAAADPGLATFPVPPAAEDEIVIGDATYRVHGVDERALAGAAALWVLTLRAQS